MKSKLDNRYNAIKTGIYDCMFKLDGFELAHLMYGNGNDIFINFHDDKSQFTIEDVENILHLAKRVIKKGS